MYEELLKEHGLKITSTRLLVLKTLDKSSSPLSAEEIYKSLKNKDVTLSTVYRALNAFVDAHLAKKEINENKENIFSLEKEEDHHVLVCVKCHKVVPINGCPYHEANEEIEKATGFSINDHNTEIYGVCPDCQKNH